MARKSKWTIKLATIEAKRYKTLKEFRENNVTAYMFLNKVDLKYKKIAISHMPQKNKWTLETVRKESLKYKTRSEFEKEDSSAYKWIHKHLSKEEKENVFKHMEIKREKWTIERVSLLAKEYKILKDFREKENAAYHWIKIHLNDKEKRYIYNHMKKNRETRTFKNIKELIESYPSFNEFIVNEPKAYNWAKRCLDIKEKESLNFKKVYKRKSSIWNIYILEKIVDKYSTMKNFQLENKSAYNWAMKKLSKEEKNKLFINLERIKYMTKENAIRLSKNFKTRGDFFKKSNTAYIYLRKNCSKKELDKIYSHMEEPYTITIEEVNKTIKRYQTKKDFEINNRSKYSWMHKNLSKKEIEELCSHMTPGNRGYQPTKPGTLYYLKIQRENHPTLYKIGITNYTVKRRFGSDMKYITIINEERFQDGSIAAEKELEILRKYKEDKYIGEPILKDGNSELFKKDILRLDS